eukprot:SAG31_NODE_28039_length_416_cov_0.854890_1_plen_60_part_01
MTVIPVANGTFSRQDRLVSWAELRFVRMFACLLASTACPSSDYYGRKGLPLQCISAVDLA